MRGRATFFFFFQTWGPRYVAHLDQVNALAYPFFSSDSCTPQLGQISANSETSILLINIVSSIGEGELGTQLCAATCSILGCSFLESLKLLKLEFSDITEKNSMSSKSEGKLEFTEFTISRSIGVTREAFRELHNKPKYGFLR